MKVLNLLVTGNPGGIETLCKNISQNKSKIDNIWMFIFSGGIIADEMKKNNEDNVIILNEKKNFFKIINTITSYCKKNNVDIITVHHGGAYTNLIYTTLKIINKNIKFVRYLHSCFETELLEESKLKRKIYKFLLQKSINKSDLVICVSNSVKDTHIKNLKLKNNNIKVIYNGISQSFFEGIHNKSNKHNNMNLIYVGRLEREKGVDILIDALSLIEDKDNNINLSIVGDGREFDKLKEKAINSGVGDKVKFLGKQLDIIKYLDESDVFIHPTRCEEAFGISIVEAMARGIVPITFKKGGLPEIIDSEENGYLVDKVDPKSLAEKIIQVSKSDLTKVRENAIESSKKYTIQNTIKGIEEAYTEIVKNKVII